MKSFYAQTRLLILFTLFILFGCSSMKPVAPLGPEMKGSKTAGAIVGGSVGAVAIGSIVLLTLLIVAIGNLFNAIGGK